MMDPSTIRSMSDRAARKAARAKKTPYVPYDTDEVNGWSSFPFPFIGSYLPEKWEKVDSLFCDSSGFGQPGEPALTQDQLKSKVRAYLALDGTYGFAVTEAGQFQCYVGVFKKVQ